MQGLQTGDADTQDFVKARIRVEAVLLIQGQTLGSS